LQTLQDQAQDKLPAVSAQRLLEQPQEQQRQELVAGSPLSQVQAVVQQSYPVSHMEFFQLVEVLYLHTLRRTPLPAQIPYH
jgi:hypothetical protein